MNYCQFTYQNRLIKESCTIYRICVLIDTSREMGSYHPKFVKPAIDIFLESISKESIINELVDVSLCESHEKFEKLSKYNRASDLEIVGIRSGGEWNLSYAFSKCVNNIYEDCDKLNRQGQSYIRPLVIVISDNEVTNNCDDFIQLDEAVARCYKNNMPIPCCYFVSSKIDNHFSHHFSNIRFLKSKPTELTQHLMSIADDIVNKVKSINNIS